MTPGNKEITQEFVRLIIHLLTVSKGFQGPNISAFQMRYNHMARGRGRGRGRGCRNMAPQSRKQIPYNMAFCPLKENLANLSPGNHLGRGPGYLEQNQFLYIN